MSFIPPQVQGMMATRPAPACNVSDTNTNAPHEHQIQHQHDLTVSRPSFSATSMTTTTCHCLQITSLRHDPKFFIPSHFAQLNLPPPASLWTSIVPVTVTPPAGADVGEKFVAENETALWLVYHDAQAARMVLAVLSAPPSQQLLRISPNIYPSLPPLPVLSPGESISSVSVDVSGGALRRRQDVVFPELGSIAAARLHATTGGNAPFSFNGAGGGGGGQLPTPRTSPVASSFSVSSGGSFAYGQPGSGNPYATHASASALGLPPMPISFPSSQIRGPRPLAPGRCGILRVQTQTQTQMQTYGNSVSRQFGHSTRFPITPPSSGASDRFTFTLPALRAPAPAAAPLEEERASDVDVDVEETRFRQLVDSLTDDDLESGLGAGGAHRREESMSVGNRARSMTVSSSGSLSTIINAFPTPPHSASTGAGASSPLTFAFRAPTSAPPAPFSFNTSFPMMMGQAPQAGVGAGARSLPSPPHSPTHTLAARPSAPLGYSQYFPRQSLPLAALPPRPALPSFTPNLNAKFPSYPPVSRGTTRAPASSSSGSGSSSAASMPQCILTPDGKALASAYGPWRAVEVSPDPAGNSVIISWPSGFALPLPSQVRPQPEHAGHPPILNTGNVGPIQAQAGDWHCGVCGYTNWRRRRICQACFPYADGNMDSGNVAAQMEKINMVASLLRAAGAGMQGPPAHPMPQVGIQHQPQQMQQQQQQRRHFHLPSPPVSPQLQQNASDFAHSRSMSTEFTSSTAWRTSPSHATAPAPVHPPIRMPLTPPPYHTAHASMPMSVDVPLMFQLQHGPGAGSLPPSPSTPSPYPSPSSSPSPSPLTRRSFGVPPSPMTPSPSSARSLFSFASSAGGSSPVTPASMRSFDYGRDVRMRIPAPNFGVIGDSSPTKKQSCTGGIAPLRYGAGSTRDLWSFDRLEGALERR